MGRRGWLDARLTLFCLAAIGCEAAPMADGPLVRDSAGVRIVETDPEVWPPPEVWTVSDSPVVTIGVVEGDPDYQLFQLQGATAGDDGGIVVAEFGARLRYYDGTGRHQRTLDLEGEGPGEAELFSRLRPYRGDSLLITTMSGSSGGRPFTSVMILAEDGSYGRDVDLWVDGSASASDAVSRIGMSSAGLHATLEDGSFLLEGGSGIPLGGSAGDLVESRAALVRVGAEGEAAETVAILRTSMYELQPLEQRGWAMVMGDASPPPVATHGMRFYRNDGWRVAVDVYEADPVGARPDSTGSDAPSAHLARSYRVHAPREPYDEANREAYTQAIVDLYEREGSDADRTEYRERIERLASPDSVPMVQDLRVDPSGHIWLEMWTPIGPRGREYARVRSYTLDSGPSRWVVLDPDGALVGSVEAPAELEVLEIGEDYLLGVVTDALGVEYIRVHRLDRGSADGNTP